MAAKPTISYLGPLASYSHQVGVIMNVCRNVRKLTLVGRPPGVFRGRLAARTRRYDQWYYGK